MKNLKITIYILAALITMISCNKDDGPEIATIPEVTTPEVTTPEVAAKVTSATLGSVDGFEGPCAKTFDFEGEIIVDGSMTVKYTWLRSDGATSPEESLEFEAAGTKTVSTAWTLGGSGGSYEGNWQQLKIISPNEMLSNKAEFDLLCDEETIAITATTTVAGEDDFTGECPKKFDFESEIEVSGPTTIKYTWLRSDGATSPEVTLEFEEAGTKTVNKSWTLGASGGSYEGYWQQIKIIAPHEMLSNKAEFDLHCDEDIVAITATASVMGEDNFTGECPKKFDFEGVIEASGPTTVKYTWIRSDGATSPQLTLEFEEAGSKTVTKSWTLGASGNSYEGYWHRLKVIAPTQVLSNKAEFDLHCDEEIVAITASASVLGEDNFTGECPKKFDFEGVIEASGPTTVKYTWIRSDGATSPQLTLEFEEAGSKTVTKSWTLGASGNSYEGYWHRLKVIAPTQVLSNKAEFDLHCDEEIVAITASASVLGEDNFTGECPKKFDFEGVIEASGPATVRYTWLRSDGGTSPVITLEFEGAGTKTVTKSWTLGASGSSYEGYWQRLKVIAPTQVLSNKAEFDLHCDEEIVAITASASVMGEDNFTGECPKKFDFEGVIEASGPTTVRYTWLRSDGGTSPEVTLEFEGAGTKTVTRSWTLGGSGSSYEGWQQLKVIAPMEVLSNKAEFNLQCIVAHSIGPIQMNPESGATLLVGEKVFFQYQYKTNEPSGVRIWGQPYTDGSPSPNFAISPSQIHPPAENGIGSGFFRVNTAGDVDQIRFWMMNVDQTELLYEIFVDVDYVFEN